MSILSTEDTVSSCPAARESNIIVKEIEVFVLNYCRVLRVMRISVLLSIITFAVF